MTAPSTAKEFLALPARRRGVIRRASIWDAGDYLLSISGTAFSERYRRYYYRDIKAIVLQKGPRMGSIGAMLLAVWFSIPFISISIIPNMPPFFRWIWLLPLLWLLWLIYVNLARSCRVFIFTAVSSDELPAIFRRRSAARALPKILNKIAEAQGDFSVRSVVENIAIPISTHEPSVEASPIPVSRQILYAISLFSVLFLASAAFAYWYRSAPWTPSNLLYAKFALPVLNGLEVATGVWGIFKLAGSRMMASLRICVFAGLGILAVRSYSLIFVISIMSQQNEVLNGAISKIHLRYWVGSADFVLSTLVGLASLISLILAWQDDRQIPAASESRGPLSGL